MAKSCIYIREIEIYLRVPLNNVWGGGCFRLITILMRPSFSFCPCLFPVSLYLSISQNYQTLSPLQPRPHPHFPSIFLHTPLQKFFFAVTISWGPKYNFQKKKLILNDYFMLLMIMRVLQRTYPTELETQVYFWCIKCKVGGGLWYPRMFKGIIPIFYTSIKIFLLLAVFENFYIFHRMRLK